MWAMLVKESVGGESVGVVRVVDGRMVCEKRGTGSLFTLLKEVFLPQGYPYSVSEDYVEYQLWDTAQALCSTLNGTLASHAVFKGMGVGDSSASAMSATYTWLLKDGTGMLSKILFAWCKGIQLDIDAKRWRLFADVVNDLAMCIELLSPLLPCSFTITMCVTSVCRSLVGVAGGCTRTTITQHQAMRNNTADVSAKDGSQETLVNLVGLALSMFLVKCVTTSPFMTWVTFLLLTIGHLYSNYKACSCLIMRSLNPARYALIIREWDKRGIVLTPQIANAREPFIAGVWFLKKKIKLGVSVSEIPVHLLQQLKDPWSSKYIVFRNKEGSVCVSYSSSVDNMDIFESYYTAVRMSCGDEKKEIICSYKADDFDEDFTVFMGELEKRDWDISFSALGVSELRFHSMN